MKQNQIDNLSRLDFENFENIFNVYKNEDGMFFYNLLQSVTLPDNLPPNLFTLYTIGSIDTWPNISFASYNTPNLWWLIVLANNIQNPMAPLVPGNTIKIPIDAVVKDVLTQLRKG